MRIELCITPTVTVFPQAVSICSFLTQKKGETACWYIINCCKCYRCHVEAELLQEMLKSKPKRRQAKWAAHVARTSVSATHSWGARRGAAKSRPAACPYTPGRQLIWRCLAKNVPLCWAQHVHHRGPDKSKYFGAQTQQWCDLDMRVSDTVP